MPLASEARNDFLLYTDFDQELTPLGPNYGRFFANRAKRHHVETLLYTLDYLVAKAADEIEGEPKAWCGFDTALDAVLAGWRPVRSAVVSDAEREKIAAENEENQRLLAEILGG